MMIYDSKLSGLDDVDVWGLNIHIHDIEVRNKDEYMTVKTPASHTLIEYTYCNWTGLEALSSDR